MSNLFSGTGQSMQPLAEKLRPASLKEVIGQEQTVEPLANILDSAGMISFVFWGPPGTGKTTLARIFANEKKAQFEPFSAVSEGVKRIREIAEQAASRLELLGQRTIIFIDEIHALKKTQQDVLLPYLEKGTFYLIGATTENPSFALNSALLSRVRVFFLRALKHDALEKILKHALSISGIKIEREPQQFLIEYANGDARIMLNLLEAAILSGKKISQKSLQQIASEKTIRYDKAGDEHYWVISAFIKSMRASDREATVYYLARMLAGGEDPRFIARRLLIFASEDIGLAEPQALMMAHSAITAAEKIGMPEVRIILSHVATFLADCPKDNSTYTAINSALTEVKHSGNLPVPLHLRNATTDFLKQVGFGSGYKYPHAGSKNIHNLPSQLQEKSFFSEQ